MKHTVKGGETLTEMFMRMNLAQPRRSMKYDNMVKRERRRAQYRRDEKARVRASLKALGLSSNVNDPCWEGR